MAEDNAIHLQQIFPDLVWNQIAAKLESETFVNFRLALPELQNTIQVTHCVQSLFPAVFRVLYSKSFLDFPDAQNCRGVCTKWSAGVDTYFQTTNFETIQNIHGARNQSDFILKLPLRPVDINRVYELDLHPRCVSFGKKLTLEINDWWHGYHHHLREINEMVHSVNSVWRHFEHLEVRGRSHPIFNNRQATPEHDVACYVVPYGDLGKNIAKEMELMEKAKRKASLYSYYCEFHPDEFEIYIPFLPHLTNLKTVTFFLHRRQVCQILLRIPRTSHLERILIAPVNENFVSWLNCSSLLYRNCCDKLEFLSGWDMQSLESFINSADSDIQGNTFKVLKELHVSIYGKEDLNAMLRLTKMEGVQKFFPKLLILQVRFGEFELRETLPANTLNSLYQLVLGIPTLEHFHLAGNCIPSECLNLRQIFRLKTNHGSPLLFQNVTSKTSVVKTFQFECPIHVPLELMRSFPMLKHIIIGEQAERCHRRVSKCKDWNYIRRIFNLFEYPVRTITFVTFSYVGYLKGLQFEPGAITHNQTDKRCRGRKRKRTD